MTPFGIGLYYFGAVLMLFALVVVIVGLKEPLKTIGNRLLAIAKHLKEIKEMQRRRP